MRGDFEEARTLYRTAAATLADLGPSVTSSTLSIESSRVEALAGDFEAAELALRRDDLALTAMGEHFYRSTVDALLAQVLAKLGRYDEAEAFSRQAEELSDAEDVDSQVFWRQGRAVAYAKTGRGDQAEVLAREAVGLARGTVNPALLAGALAELAAVLIASGRTDETGPPLREALEIFELKGDLTSVRRVRQLLGEATPV
jgi:tetratricopeptide (TPR) repeat protein